MVPSIPTTLPWANQGWELAGILPEIRKMYMQNAKVDPGEGEEEDI